VTVLVTGASGFVGSAIVRRLVRNRASLGGARVDHIVALLGPSGSTARLDELPNDGSWSAERVDVADHERLTRLIERLRPSAIVHAALAADAYRIEDEERLVRQPLETMLESLAGIPRARFIQAGSAWALGPGERIDEFAALAPTTVYGRNKARADELLPRLADERRVPWINLRLFNLFGRYEKSERLLPTLVDKLSRGEAAELTHGEQVRDFNDVDTAAQAFADALAAPDDACGRVYHIGSGRGTTVREFAFMVAASLGGSAGIRFGDASTDDQELAVLVADPGRARGLLGWRPDPDLSGAVRDAVEWWLAHLRAEMPLDIKA
jgi:nucleoside-diphosphate-sugar epimerase